MSQAISPQIQMANQQLTPEYATELFKQRFTQLAYQMLLSKFSDLAPHIVTFKLLDVDHEKGTGVGTLILNYQDKVLYIPVVMVESQLKPMEMFYCKDLNIFLPLSAQWIDEVSKMALSEMGSASKLPQEVPQDVNIRDLVMPPMTTSGRVGFASANDSDLDSRILFKEAENHNLEIHPQFLNVMRTAPKLVLDGVKLAFEQNPRLLDKFVKNYGVTNLVNAMSEGYAHAKYTQKTAATRDPGKVCVLTKTSSQKQFQEIFGQKAGEAFSQAVKTGFAVSDTRPGIAKVAVKIEVPAFLETPGPQAGWYRLYFVDGKSSIYYVIPVTKGANTYWGTEYGKENDHRLSTEFLVIDPTGKEVWFCDELVGQPIPDPELGTIRKSKIYKILQGAKGDTPTPRSYGFYLNKNAKGTATVRPFRVDTVSTDNGVTRVTAEYGSHTFLVEPKNRNRQKFVTVKDDIVLCPHTAKYVEILKLKDNNEEYRQLQDYSRERKNSVIRDPKILLYWANHMLQQSKAKPTKVKSAGLNQWWIDDSVEALYAGPALEKVANLYNVSVEDAVGLLLDAQECGRSQSYILDPESGRSIKQAFEKMAQMPEEGPMQYQSQPGQMQGLPMMGDPTAMQPEMAMQMPMTEQGFDPMQLGQQPPPAPLSPTDLAIGEAIQGLAQQNEMMQQQNQSQIDQLQQSMQMQSQNNEQLIGVLQGIQQRSSELAQATNGQIPPGALESPAIAAQMLAPTPPPPPEAMPTPMMDAEGQISPETIADQINPSMVNMVDQFNDQNMFDTAAIAMLATAPVLQDIISAYVPNLEKAIDNLGRILLTLWMKEEETKEAIGDENYIDLEDRLRNVFKNMGEVVLSLSHNAMSVVTEADKAQMQMQSHSS